MACHLMLYILSGVEVGHILSLGSLVVMSTIFVKVLRTPVQSTGSVKWNKITANWCFGATLELAYCCCELFPLVFYVPFE